MPGPTLDATGLDTQTLAEVKAELQAKYKELFGPGIQLADDTNAGKFIGIYSDREAKIQEALEGVYWSQYLSTAQGTGLDFVLERIGIQRKSAQPSTLPLTIYAAGTPSAAISAEALRMSVDGTGSIFYNSEIFTLGSLVDESIDSLTRVGTTAKATIGGGHSFPLDSWVFIVGSEQEQYNNLHQITAITATTFDYELSGTLPISPATGTIEAKEATPFNARSELTGPVQALAGAITTIETAGVDLVENSLDAVLGNNIETDGEVRARAFDSLGGTGAATQPAIRAKLLGITGVTFAAVFQNVTDFVDANGLPPHSIRAVVDGGADADIWNILYLEAVSAGIQMDGTETTNIVDDNGDPQPVAFSRPTSVRLYVDAGNSLVTNSDIAQGPVYPVDGDDQVKANLASIVFGLGGDVWPATIKEAIARVVGVISCDPEFGTSPDPSNKVTIVIAAGSRANIDIADVVVTP